MKKITCDKCKRTISVTNFNKHDCILITDELLNKVRLDYNNGLKIIDLHNKFGHTVVRIALNNHRHSRSEAVKLSYKFHPESYIRTDETKRKISNSLQNICQKKRKCDICNRNFSIANFNKHTCVTSDVINKIRLLYDDNFTTTQLYKDFSKSVVKIALQGYHRSRSESSRLAHKIHPECFKRTIEQKEKMSVSKKKYFELHPEKLPYRLRHSSNVSYVEELFKEALIKNNIKNWVQHYGYGIYEFDFAFPIEKIDVEIDGKTHTIDKVKMKDQVRDKKTKQDGWKVIRFNANVIKNNIDKCILLLKQYLINGQRDISTDNIIFIQKTKDRKKQQKQLLLKAKRQQYLLEQELLKNKLQQSKINFSSFGWVKKAAIILNRSPQKVCCWMRKYMSEFYNEKCFHTDVAQRSKALTS